jgi:hypothetical protein
MILPIHVQSAPSPTTLTGRILHGKHSPGSTNPKQIQPFFAAQTGVLEQHRQASSFRQQRNERAYHTLDALPPRYMDART